MARIAVTGGRKFSDYTLVEAWILYVHQYLGIEVLIHGVASGADTLADMCCKRHMIPILPFKALWNKHGRKAGPLRNIQMIEEGQPELLLAFPGGVGTAHMIKECKTRGIPVILAHEMPPLEI